MRRILAGALFLLWLAFFAPELPGEQPVFSGSLRGSSDRWRGADGAFSIPLGREERLWLFGDTWISTLNEGLTLVSNTVAVQRGKCESPLRVHWRRQAGAPRSLFEPSDGIGWLWPAGGIMAEGELYLFYHRIIRGQSRGNWDFAPRGTELIKIVNPKAPPDLWIIRSSILPWDIDDFLLGASPVIERPYLLAMGSRAAGMKRELVIARITLKALQAGREDAWQFLTGTGADKRWAEDEEAAAGLFKGIGTEFSLAKGDRGPKWLCVYSPGGISPEIHIRRASHLEGPWGPPKVLFGCPEQEADSKVFCYGAKIHPECVGESERGLWITYSVNTQDGMSYRGDLSYPRWVYMGER